MMIDYAKRIESLNKEKKLDERLNKGIDGLTKCLSVFLFVGVLIIVKHQYFLVKSSALF